MLRILKVKQRLNPQARRIRIHTTTTKVCPLESLYLAYRRPAMVVSDLAGQALQVRAVACAVRGENMARTAVSLFNALHTGKPLAANLYRSVLTKGWKAHGIRSRPEQPVSLVLLASNAHDFYLT